MATKSILEYTRPASEIDIDALELTSESGSKIVLTDTASGQVLIFQGSKLLFDDGTLQSGRVDKVTVQTDAGDLMMTMNNIGMKVSTVPDGTLIDGMFQYSIAHGLLHDNLIQGSSGVDILTAMPGNDVVKAGAGNDQLAGGPGADKLYGGSGEDLFFFREGDGKDKIMDFDADGGEGAQDMIAVAWDDVVDVRDSKAGAVIDFGHGDMVTLVGVKAKHIDDSDFTM